MAATAERTSTPFYVTGGTLPPDASSYVERAADRELLSALLSGEYCYVLNSRQMGKSSLCVRTIGRLTEEGVRTVFLDLTKYGGRNLTAEQWYAALLADAGRELGLRSEFLSWWKEKGELGPMQRFFEALSEVALSSVEGPLVVFVDEIDVTLSLPFSTDEFFAAIRQLYVGRATRPELSRLTFCLLGTATPADLIQDTRVSPFNIGRRIEVRDFTPEEAAPLAIGLGESGSKLLERVLYWTGGHPYLTQRLCRAAAESQARSIAEVDRVCTELFLTHMAKESDDNLAFVRNRLLRSEADIAALLDLYRRLRQGGRVLDDETNPLTSILKLSGVAKVEAGTLKVRNRIYGHVFDRTWIAQHMPDAELRRQRAAYWRGAMRSASLAAVAMGAMTVLVIVNINNAVRATTAEANAKSVAGENKQLADDRAKALAAANIARVDANRNAIDANTQRKAAELKAREAAGNLALARRALADAVKARSAEASSKRRAEKSATVASRRAEEAARYLYTSNMSLIQREWERDDVRRVRLILDEIPIQRRGHFEWRYWNRRTQGNVVALTTKARANWDVAVTESGELFSCSEDDSLVSWDLTNHRPRQRYRGAPAGLTELTISPNGGYIAGVCRDGAIYVWKRNQPDRARRLVPSYPQTSLQYSKDGQWLISGGFGGAIFVWDADNCALLYSIKALEGYPPADSSIRLAVSPDSKAVAVTGYGNTVALVDLASRQVRQTLTGRKDTLFSVDYAPDGNTVAAGSQDGTVLLWDVRRSAPPVVLTGHNNFVSRVRFLSDNRLASCSADQTALLWDVKSRTAIRAFRGHTGTAYSLCFLRGKSTDRLVTAGHDNSIRIWNLDGDKEFEQWPIAKLRLPVPAASFSPDGERIAMLSGQQSPDSLRIYRIRDRRLDVNVTVPPDVTGRIAFSRNGSLIALPAIRRTVLMDAFTGELRGELRVPAGRGDLVFGADFSPDGKFLVTGDWDGVVRIWDLSRFSLVHELAGHRNRVNAVRFSPDGRLIASCSYDGTVKFWSLNSQRELQTIEVQPGAVIWDVAFSPRGERFVTGDERNQTKVWNTSTRKLLHTLVGHSYFVYSASFSADGTRLITAGDRTARLWDVETGRELLVLRGHDGFVSSAALSADGNRLVTVCQDGVARLWDTNDR